MEPSETAWHGRQTRSARTQDGRYRVLIVGRRRDEAILIPAHGIEIVVTHISRGRVRLGITAPEKTTIIRREIAAKYGHYSDHAAVGEHRGTAPRAAGGEAPPAAPGGRSDVAEHDTDCGASV